MVRLESKESFDDERDDLSEEDQPQAPDVLDLHPEAPVICQDEPVPQQVEPDLNVPETHENVELVQEDVAIIDN